MDRRSAHFLAAVTFAAGLIPGLVTTLIFTIAIGIWKLLTVLSLSLAGILFHGELGNLWGE